MERRGGGGSGTCMTLLTVALVSTGIFLVSYTLNRRIQADYRALLGLDDAAQEEEPRQRRRPHRGGKKKKVWFADIDVVEPAMPIKEDHRRRSTVAAACGRGGSLVQVLRKAKAAEAPPPPYLRRN